MANLTAAWRNVHFIEELASGRTIIHRLHPVAKLMTVLAFLVTVASFNRYDIAPLLPLSVFPVTLLILGDLPIRELAKRTFVASPVALGVGIFNPLWDHSVSLVIGGFVITGGWISFFSIVLRFVLSVLTALILIAVSGIGQIADALRALGIPRAFVVQIVFLYRYISVLGEEVGRSLRAYSLRSSERQGIHYRAWGSLIGQLILRTIDRAARVYHAMRCRGFDGDFKVIRDYRFRWADAAFLAGWVGFFAVVRFVNLSELIGSMVMGGGR